RGPGSLLQDRRGGKATGRRRCAGRGRDGSKGHRVGCCLLGEVGNKLPQPGSGPCGGLAHWKVMTTATLAPAGTLLIRPATAADYPHIARITVDSYLHAGHFDDPDHEYLQFVQQVAKRHADSEILVAERDGVVIG